MKKTKEKKLRLGKFTVRDFETELDDHRQKEIKGGSQNQPYGITDLPVVCIP